MRRCYRLKCVPPPFQHLYAVILTPRILDCDLIWKKSNCKCNWLRGGHSEVGWTPNLVWWLPLFKGKIQRRIHKQVECPVMIKAEVRMMQQKPRKLLESKRESWNRFPPHIPERDLCQHLNLGFQASTIVRQQISVV